MKISQVLREIRTSGFAEEQLPAEDCLGLPVLVIKEGHLFLRLVPHRLSVRRDSLSVGMPSCFLELAYPFRRLVAFRRLMESGFQVCLCVDQVMEYRNAIAQLYVLCDDVLAEYEAGKCPSIEGLAAYAVCLDEILGGLGLEEVYAPAYLKQGGHGE